MEREITPRERMAAEFQMTAMSVLEYAPPAREINRWTEAEVKSAMDWAHAEYLYWQIAVTGMERPTKPAILAHYREIHHGTDSD